MGVAAGFVLLSPVVASAAEAPTGNPTSMKVEVDEADNVTIEGTCVNSAVEAEAGYRVPGGHQPILYSDLITGGKTGYVVFKHVPPGKYEAYIYCHEGGPGDHRGPVRTFTVGKPAKPAPSAKPAAKPAPQVGVKPQGAPQTGGGPADDESAATPLLAGGAIALVGAAGAGALVLRRRAARR
ncbi:hypothetical protein ACFVYA_03170 [Amycolatopsis sp. NPDC058278]|uniref:hypothetical protein n=1 Tax=Amycolatopsis sp. NPDC058278 TaxID=3346417 RepID=UPI0036D96851